MEANQILILMRVLAEEELHLVSNQTFNKVILETNDCILLEENKENSFHLPQHRARFGSQNSAFKNYSESINSNNNSSQA